MKDKNGNEIKVGHLVKRCGYVQYADEKRYKISKKTWLISKVGNGELYYEDRFIGSDGREVVHDAPLKVPKDEGSFIIVGDKDKGVSKEFLPTESVVEAPVGQNYRIHKEDKKKDWKVGDIVRIHGRVAKEVIDRGDLEKVPDTIEHKHTLVVVDPIKINFNVKNG